MILQWKAPRGDKIVIDNVQELDIWVIGFVNLLVDKDWALGIEIWTIIYRQKLIDCRSIATIDS